MASQPARAENFGRKTDEAIDDVRDTASGAMKTVRDAASNVVQKAQDVASGVADKMGDAYTATSDKAVDFYDDVTSLVKRYPTSSVLIAFGVGCMLGSVILGSVYANNNRRNSSWW